ncbi:MAG: hypothetical protein J7K17_00380, partial [Candidatus Omnitrophica bacterium]|nr:hypothetical protein [Candidatus Omnitrophota bacterium]
LEIFALYFGLNEIRNWLTDKLPHLSSVKESTTKLSIKRSSKLKRVIHYLISKEDIHPGKHSRAMFTTGIGTPIFAAISFAVFYLLHPISGILWVLLATVILGSIGGAYNGYMRGKQYPEPHIRREEYKKNYALTFLTCILIYYSNQIISLNSGVFHPFVLALTTSNSIAYLVFRRVLSEAWHGLIDLKGGFKKCEIAKGFEIVVPPKIRIYEPKKESVFNIKEKGGFYDEWREEREKKESELAEKISIDDLSLKMKRDIDKILPQSLDTKEGLEEFAEDVLRGFKSFSLTEEAILNELVKEGSYTSTMEEAHRILGGRYEPWIEDYTPRERLALAWFITNPAKGWEEIFKDRQFALQDVKVVILDKEIAELAGFPEERIKDGVFGDADTGCVIIINREWDKLELLLRLEKARAKLEIFTRVAQRLKGKNFGENLVTFHNQWAGYKEDIWHRQIRPVLEGKEQALIFEYMEELFRAIKKEEMRKPVSRRKLPKEELKNLMNLAKEFKQYYAFPEKLPEDLFNKEEAKNFVLYNFVLKFIEYSEISQIKGILKRGESLKVNEAEGFLDELLCAYSTKLDLGKNIWRAISEYTRDKKERTFSERLIDWIDEKILSPKVILSLTLLILIAIAIYRWGIFLSGNLSLLTAGLSLAMVSIVREGKIESQIEEELFDGGEENEEESSIDKVYNIFSKEYPELTRELGGKPRLERLIGEIVRKINRIVKDKAIEEISDIRIYAYKAKEEYDEEAISSYSCWQREEGELKGKISINLLDPNLDFSNFSAYKLSLQSLISQLFGQHIVVSPLLLEAYKDKKVIKGKIDNWQILKDKLFSFLQKGRHIYLKDFKVEIKRVLIGEEIADELASSVINTLANSIGAQLIENEDYNLGKRRTIDYFFRVFKEKSFEDYPLFAHFQMKKDAQRMHYREDEFSKIEERMIKERPQRKAAFEVLDTLFTNISRVKLKGKEQIEKEKIEVRRKELERKLEKIKKGWEKIKDGQKRKELKQLLNELRDRWNKMGIAEIEKRLRELERRIKEAKEKMPVREIKVSDLEFNQIKERFPNLYIKENKSSSAESILNKPDLLSKILTNAGIELESLLAILEAIEKLGRKAEELFIQELKIDCIEIFSSPFEFKNWQEVVSGELFEFDENKLEIVYQINLRDARFGQPDTEKYQEAIVSLAAHLLGLKSLVLSLWKEHREEWVKRSPQSLKNGLSEDSGLKNLQLDVDKYEEFGFKKEEYKELIAREVLIASSFKIAQALLGEESFNAAMSKILFEELKYDEWVINEGSIESKESMLFDIPLFKAKLFSINSWRKPFKKKIMKLVDRLDKELPHLEYRSFFNTLSNDCIELFKKLKVAQRVYLSEMLPGECREEYREGMRDRLKEKMGVDVLPEIVDKELFEETEREVQEEWRKKKKDKTSGDCLDGGRSSLTSQQIKIMEKIISEIHSGKRTKKELMEVTGLSAKELKEIMGVLRSSGLIYKKDGRFELKKKAEGFISEDEVTQLGKNLLNNLTVVDLLISEKEPEEWLKEHVKNYEKMKDTISLIKNGFRKAGFSERFSFACSIGVLLSEPLKGWLGKKEKAEKIEDILNRLIGDFQRIWREMDWEDELSIYLGLRCTKVLGLSKTQFRQILQESEKVLEEMFTEPSITPRRLSPQMEREFKQRVERWAEKWRLPHQLGGELADRFLLSSTLRKWLFPSPEIRMAGLDCISSQLLRAINLLRSLDIKENKDILFALKRMFTGSKISPQELKKSGESDSKIKRILLSQDMGSFVLTPDLEGKFPIVPLSLEREEEEIRWEELSSSGRRVIEEMYEGRYKRFPPKLWEEVERINSQIEENIKLKREIPPDLMEEVKDLRGEYSEEEIGRINILRLIKKGLRSLGIDFPIEYLNVEDIPWQIVQKPEEKEVLSEIIVYLVSQNKALEKEGFKPSERNIILAKLSHSEIIQLLEKKVDKEEIIKVSQANHSQLRRWVKVKLYPPALPERIFIKKEAISPRLPMPIVPSKKTPLEERLKIMWQRRMAEAHFRKGEEYYSKYRVKEAKAEFKLALLLNPEHKEARKGIINCKKEEKIKDIYRQIEQTGRIKGGKIRREVVSIAKDLKEAVGNFEEKLARLILRILPLTEETFIIPQNLPLERKREVIENRKTEIMDKWVIKPLKEIEPAINEETLERFKKRFTETKELLEIIKSQLEDKREFDGGEKLEEPELVKEIEMAARSRNPDTNLIWLFLIKLINKKSKGISALRKIEDKKTLDLVEDILIERYFTSSKEKKEIIKRMLIEIGSPNVIEILKEDFSPSDFDFILLNKIEEGLFFLHTIEEDKG